jgi:hypothetical protein
VEALLRRTPKGLEAADEAAIQTLRKVSQGSEVLAEIRRPRKLNQHRKWRKILDVVWQSCGTFETIDALHNDIKFRVGFVTRQKVVDFQTGELLAEIIVPKSTSFASCDQDEFESYMEAAIRAICEQIVPGMDDGLLREEIYRAIG